MFLCIDSLFMCLRMDSFDSCNELLLLSNVLFYLRDFLDLGGFIPQNDQRSLIYEQLLDQWNGQESVLRGELLKNSNRPGSYKPEYPFSTEFISIPSRFLSLREKAYHLEVLHQKTAECSMVVDAKIAARCGIKKSRMLKYTMNDFLRMSDVQKINYVSGLQSLRSKHFHIYQITSSRAEPTTFTRKKYTFKNGRSVPFGYYGISIMEAAERSKELYEEEREAKRLGRKRKIST